MSISPGYTNEQIRQIVHGYEHQPHGSKGLWLQEQGISHDRLTRWRAAVVAGDLDRGLVPRHGGVMTSPPRRRAVVDHCNAHDQQAELDRLAKRVEELEATNEALGKAIGLLHRLNEHGPDTTQTSEPSSS
jgi:hypothetical protein